MLHLGRYSYRHLGVTIPCMVKKSLTRSAINIVYGDLVYGSNHMKTINVSENNHVSELCTSHL